MTYKYHPELSAEANQQLYTSSLILLFREKYEGSDGQNIIMTFAYDHIRDSYMVYHEDRLIKVLCKRAPDAMWQSTGGVSSRFVVELGEMIEAWLEKRLLGSNN